MNSGPVVFAGYGLTEIQKLDLLVRAQGVVKVIEAEVGQNTAATTNRGKHPGQRVQDGP